MTHCVHVIAVMTGVALTEEERESVWDEISDEVSVLLQGERELPESAVPFDAASSVSMEQQRSDLCFTHLNIVCFGPLCVLFTAFGQLYQKYFFCAIAPKLSNHLIAL